MNTVTVRSAHAEDAPILVEFNRAMALESEGKALDPGALSQGIAYLLNNPDEGFYVVAEHGSTITGALMVTYEWSDWRNGRFWWIQSVFVRPEWRRRGVYSALHRWVRQRAADAGSCGIRLYVERNNVGAQATYSSLEMVETAYRLFEEEFSPR